MRRLRWAFSYGLSPPETPKNYPYLTRRYSLRERIRVFVGFTRDLLREVKP